ncbi:glycosyltransferase [Pseudomonas alkylphenolica]|uniref:glycosyltransferase n=1 Tax=Pseudomonas alkylphenolica TaxID=237609 RepID=UPI0018D5C35A|nr:glycosyltransferase [Pseudomonas alkylphenolica]MBH3427766.1 glycosyltransferase [Pseudomonas alkylphenolica]
MLNSVQAGAGLEQAMKRLRLMYARPEHPYYIMAPGYRETSSGVASLHYLCHLLNLNGREAYICGGKVVNPELKTPLLDDETRQRHRLAGRVPIAVYPEVTTGNPYNCSVVARFLLNFEGFITGRGMEAAPSDLLFYSGKLIAEDHGHPDGDLLCLPTIDVDLFCTGQPSAQREGRYLYQNRYPLDAIDYSILPADIRLLSMANALTLPELAQLLQQAEVMYTHEWSMTCVIAVLCGCPVIFIPGHGIDQAFLDASFVGSSGFAMLDREDALAHAQAGLEGALQRYVERTAPFWSQLDVFIAKTQASACREVVGNRLGVRDWLRQRYPQPQQMRVIEDRLADATAARFTVLVVDHGDPAALAITLDSLARGLCPGVKVCVLGRDNPGLSTVQWLQCNPAQAVLAIEACLRGCESDWFMLVDAGSEFTASGLLLTALELTRLPVDCLAVYADEALCQAQGVVDTALRPDFNLDMLLAFPGYLSRHWLYRCDAWRQLGGFSEAGGRAFELDFQLRLISERGLGCIGHVGEPLLIGNALQLQACADECAVIEAHLQGRGYSAARALPLAAAPGRYRIDYGHQPQASVSIVIFLEGQLLHFQRCLESLLAQTTHGDYEVLLVEPGGDDPLLLDWLAMVGQMGGGRFNILRFEPGHTRAAMCNAAAHEAQGEYLLWLDAGSAVLDGDWLQVLLNHAQRPEVGAVGCKLVSRDSTVRQAALVLGLGGGVGRAFEGRSTQDAGYMGRLGLEQDCSAVGGECLMVRRSLFIESGGFEIDPLFSRWVAVDLCLKLLQAGYLNVWTPHARLLLEATQDAPAGTDQEDALYARWLPQLARDPAYNVNFSLRAGEEFAVQGGDMSWRPLRGLVPTVLACADGQSGAVSSRLLGPMAALRGAGSIDGAVIAGTLSPVEIERFNPSSIVLQRPLEDSGLLTMRRLRAFSQAFKVYDLDRYVLDIDDGQLRSAEDLEQRIRFGVMQADRVLVATAALAELVRAQLDDVQVLENVLHPSWGRLQGARRMGEKPRVGWLGCQDAYLLAEVVPMLAGEVEWVVLGDCPDALRPYLKEHHPAVDLDYLGVDLAALNLDIALVPMAETLINRCSGDIRVLQHAACGQSVICSRVAGFAGGDALPLSRVSNDAADWVRAIRLHLEDLGASAALGDAQQALVRSEWLLQGQRLEDWRLAWLAN